MGNTLCRCQKLAGPDVALHPRCFGQVWIFEGIPPEAWESLAGDLVRRRLSAGEDLFQQGEPAESGIDRRTFESLVTRYPDVGLVVIRNLSRRIDHLSGKLGAFSEPNLDDRLYEILANVARDLGTPAPGGWTIAFPLTHEEIGFLVGAHRVSVTRALGKLRDTGRVRTAGKFLFVRDTV